MKRREAFRLAASGSAAGLLGARAAGADAKVEKALRGLPSPKITDVRAIATAPAGLRLVVVKVTTDQDGLYGYGCATFTQRADLVPPAVDRYLKPFLVGKPADRIEDTWQALYASSYWRNGPVLNNAISGVDMALWDIKGRQAGMPVYQLLGGKAREAADCYGHASGSEIAEVLDNARALVARGFRHVRVQVGVPGMAGYGIAARRGPGHGASLRPGLRARRLHASGAPAPRGGAQGARRRGGAPPRRPRADLPHPGPRLLQGRGAVPPLLPRGPRLARGHRLVPAHPPAVRDPPRDGRALQQPPRVGPPHLRAAHRLHPRPRLAGGRPHPLPEDGGPRRALRREDGVARARRRLAGGPRLQHRPRPRLRQLRHPGVVHVRRHDARGLLGLPGARGTATSTRTRRPAGASRSTSAPRRSTRSATARRASGSG